MFGKSKISIGDVEVINVGSVLWKLLASSCLFFCSAIGFLHHRTMSDLEFENKNRLYTTHLGVRMCMPEMEAIGYTWNWGIFFIEKVALLKFMYRILPAGQAPYA